jgi:DNA polymerase
MEAGSGEAGAAETQGAEEAEAPGPQARAAAGGALERGRAETGSEPAVPSGGPPDATVPSAGPPDAAVPSAGPPDAAVPSAGPPDAAVPSAGPTPGARPSASRGSPLVLEQLASEAAVCTKCALHEGRTHSVFARGNPRAELGFVGEGPGFNEDQQGLPFVGPAGQLLDKMIAAMGYRPDDVYICNVVKCRPPNNRTPRPDEAAACLPYLEGQLEEVAPRVLVALGRTAAVHLGCVEPDQRGWRGRWYRWRDIPVMATYHPAFLLRSPDKKRPVWQDLKQVMAHLGKRPG